MTEDEFKDFVRQLYGTFPGLKEWVLKNAGADQAITHRAWFTTLKVCTKVECMDVLAGWLNGKFPVFEAYERDKIAFVIRQTVMAERDKAARRNKTRGVADEYRKTDREHYRSAMEGVPGLADVYRKGCELRRKMLDGEITEEQMRAEQRRLVDSVQ